MATFAELEAARLYLTPPSQSFWQWRDDGEVIAWPDGRTIAFRAELADVLRQLAPDGLPPVGAVLLLMAAARDSWSESASDVGRLADLMDFIKGEGGSTVSALGIDGVKTSRPAWIDEVRRGLDAVHALPQKLRQPTTAKRELVAMVCESSRHRDRSIDGEAVVRMLERGLPEAIFAAVQLAPREENAASFSIAIGQLELLLRDLRCLHSGLPRLDPGRLALRLATGLEELPAMAPIELTPAEQTRALIAQLADDAELGGIARLARNLMAAVHLPRPMSEREDLPLGGVSDISNRGALDRLLVSELAHDDLTLAVRVAVNEALYLRREAPPRNPPRQRYVLLDAGIRMWGVPRVFAAAVGLALAATSDRQTTTHVFRAVGNGVAEVDFSTRAGLVDHLAALEPAAHPGEALPAFFARSQEAGLAADAVLVTGDDVLADKAFQRALAETASPNAHLASVDREGRFRLFAAAGRGRKPSCDVRLPLQEILTPRRPAGTALIDARRSIRPPGILSAQPFPLLLSHPLEFERAWAVMGNGVFTITRDGRLLHWKSPQEGGRQLAACLPPGDLHWASVATSDVTTHAVVGRLSQKGLCLVSADMKSGTHRVERLLLDHDAPRGVAGHNGAILVLFDDHVEAFGQTSGARLGHFRLPSGVRRIRGRFLRTTNLDCHALAFNGVKVQMELVSKSAHLVDLFDVQGVDGPMGLTDRGELYDSAEKTTKKIVHGHVGPTTLVAVSRDGLRMVVGTKPPLTQRNWLVQLPNGSPRVIQKDVKWQVEPEIASTIRTKVLRHRFDGIAVLEEGTLGLVSRKGAWFEIAADPIKSALVLRKAKPQRVKPRRKAFDRDCSDPDFGYSLRAAVWDDGSVAFLDSRGLLHLRSSDTGIPETTIVLCDGRLAGWVMDGRRFGPSYFHGWAENLASDAVADKILKPFASQLPC